MIKCVNPKTAKWTFSELSENIEDIRFRLLFHGFQSTEANHDTASVVANAKEEGPINQHFDRVPGGLSAAGPWQTTRRPSPGRVTVHQGCQTATSVERVDSLLLYSHWARCIGPDLIQT